MKRFLKWAGIAIGSAIALLVAGILIARQLSDGPLGPISGGSLRAGELVTGPVTDWSFAERKIVELELVSTEESRVTGSMLHEGKLYIPCDLGFLWRRLPSTGFRAFASVLRRVKHWHHDAEKDGRAVVRIDGKRYEGKLVRVTDPELLAALRSVMEVNAARYMNATLMDIPADPEEIWFFRVDPRG